MSERLLPGHVQTWTAGGGRGTLAATVALDCSVAGSASGTVARTDVFRVRQTENRFPRLATSAKGTLVSKRMGHLVSEGLLSS